MTIKRSTLQKLAFSTFLLTLPLNAALAQDAAVADRLKAALAAQGVDISWTGVTGDNTSMTFDLGGYTIDFIKSLQEMQKKMAAQPQGADNSAQGMRLRISAMILVRATMFLCSVSRRRSRKRYFSLMSSG